MQTFNAKAQRRKGPQRKASKSASEFDLLCKFMINCRKMVSLHYSGSPLRYFAPLRLCVGF
jgi:hypothetical protein